MSERRQAYDFLESVEASRRGKESQERAEDDRKKAIEDLAEAERQYRMLLAKEILTMKAQGTPATVCQDLARGVPLVADLRYKRDVAQGIADVAEQRAWRGTADRRDIQELIQWSRLVAPLGEQFER